MRKSRRLSQTQRVRASAAQRNARLRRIHQAQRIDSAELDALLRQWALSVYTGADDGPRGMTRCASAEAHYRAPEWEGEPMALPDPNPDDVDRIEYALRKVDGYHKAILKMHYIRLFHVPVERTENYVISLGARLLKMRPFEYERGLHAARAALYRALRT